MNHKQYIKTIIAIVGFAIVGWLSFMRPDWLLLLGILMGACGYGLLLTIFTPVGHLKLGEQPPSLTTGQWLTKLLLGQLALLIFSVACAVALFAAGPEFSLSKVTFSDLQKMIVQRSRFEWGLFPWNAAGVWGVVIAYVAYVQKGEPYLYQAGYKIYPKQIEPMFKSYIESITVGATLLLLAFIVSAIILLYTYSVNFYFQVSHFKIPIFTVILMSFLGPLASLSFGRKVFRTLSGGRHTTLNRIILVLIALLVPIMIASAFVTVYLIAHRAELQQSLICKECGNYFENVPLGDRLAALYWGWWLLWTPLAGSYLAKISQGRTIREFVIALYAVPILCILGWVYLSYHPLQLPALDLQPQWLSIGLFLLATLLLLVMMICFKAVKDTSIFLSGYMQPSNGSKANRLWLKDASKTLGITRLSPKLLMAILGMLFLHATGGWFGIQLQASAMGALVMNAVYMGFYLVLCQWLRSRKHQKAVYTARN